MQKDGRYFKLVKLQMEGEHYSTTPQLVKKDTTDDAKQPAQQIGKPGEVDETRNNPATYEVDGFVITQYTVVIITWK